jgi:hypothetical protein
MKIIYQSEHYKPELVTGRYVRCDGRKGAYRFVIIEASSGQRKPFLGKPGHGPTLRQYETDGAELPPELREKCIKDKNTEKWD